MEKYKEDFILFVESGFIAVNQSDEDSARKLFKAAELLNPESSLPTIGLGYLHLHKLELKEACAKFESVLQKEPNNEMVKTFLGLCMVFSPQAVMQGEKILEETLKSQDTLVKNLSKSALDFVDAYVKKHPTPLQAPLATSKNEKKGKKHGRKPK